MKKLLMAIVCLHACGTVVAQQKVKTEQAANAAGKMSFASLNHDFKEVTEGPDVECDFVFTNTGKQPITITNAVAGCGCTSPTWPKEPIMPGKTGKIHVAYHTKGRVGPFTKSVTVTSNAEQPTTVLNIKGTVNAADVASKKN